MGASTLTGTEFARANKSYSSYNIAWVGSYALISQDPIANTSTIRLYGSMYTDSASNVRSGNSSDVFKVNGVTISPPTPTEYRYSSSLTYGYSVNRYYSLFGSTDITVQHNANGTFPAQTISIYANDYHHNAQTASGTISGIATIDRAAPTVSISLESRTDTSLKVKATANTNCDVWYYSKDNGSTWTQFSTTNGTTATATITGLTKGTSYNIKIRARKTYNHVEGTSSTGAYTTTDSTPPTVSASISNVTANSCTLSASANVTCNKWEYSLNGGSSWTTFSTTSGTSASTTISGLSPATTYTITVRATRSSNSVTGTATASASTLGFSTIASIGATNTGSKNTLTFLSYSGSFYFRIQYKLGNTVLATENIGTVAAGTTKSYTSTYAFPHSLLPNSTSATITATLYTYSNSGYTSLVGSDSKTFTLTVPSSVKPTISSVTLAPYNTNSWINSKGYWVAGFTRADVTTSATAGSGASISSIVATGDITGTGASFRSGVLSSGTKSVTVTVTDSRGRTATRTVTQVVQAYNSPTATIVSAQRGTYANGTWTADEDGNHIRVQATGAVSLSGNVCTLHCIIGANAEQTTTGTSGTWYATNTDNEHVYQIQVWASDSVGTVGSRSIVTVSSSEVPFSWNEDRIGFGMVAQSPQTVEVSPNWKLVAHGKNNQFAYMPYSFNAIGEAGSLGWTKIATITITENYCDAPIEFIVQRRFDKKSVKLSVLFASGATTDPSLSSFVCEDISGTYTTNAFMAFINRVSASVWDIYVNKANANDQIGVFAFASAFTQAKCKITYSSAIVASVPSGAVMATRLMPETYFYNALNDQYFWNASITTKSDARFYRTGNVVQCYIRFNSPSSITSGQVIGTIPTGYRPTYGVVVNATKAWYEGATAPIQISTGGAINFVNQAFAANTAYIICASWITSNAFPS